MEKSEPYSTFTHNYGRLQAFFTELCEAPNLYKEDIVKLSRELSLMQLIAMADVYRNDIMGFILRANLNLVKQSKDKLSFAEIIELKDWDILCMELINREMPSWTKNLAFEEWVRRIKQELLINLNVEDGHLCLLGEIIATRNVLAHRGMIDQQYLKRSSAWYNLTSNPRPMINSYRNLDNVYFRNASRCLFNIIENIDAEVSKYI